MTMKILAADIGGTNSRFACFEADEGRDPVLLDHLWLKSKEVTGFAELLRKVAESDLPFKPADSDMAVAAVAGPVRAKRYAKLSNAPWDIDVSRAKSDYSMERCYLINDFTAQAFACRTKAVSNAMVLQAGEAVPDAALAVIGAGTGLGHCALMPDGHGGHIAVPSEAGHQLFAFKGEEEWEFGRFVIKETGLPYVYAEIVVSGLGLKLLHKYFAGEDLEPWEAAAKLDDYPEVAEWFARFYGRVSRHYALSVLSQAGFYLSGGVAAKNHILVTHPAFLEEFHESVKHARILARMPVLLNSNEDSGLYGAALYGLYALQA